MKNSLVTHCSDECLLDLIRNSQSLNENEISAAFWDEKSDPWT